MVDIHECTVVHGHCVNKVTFASPEGFISVGAMTKQFIHAFNCVSWSFNAFGKFREHKKDYSCSWLGFEQPLRFFRALQTSCASRLDQTLWCALLWTRRYHLPYVKSDNSDWLRIRDEYPAYVSCSIHQSLLRRYLSCNQMQNVFSLQALQRAGHIISEVRDTHIW